MNANETDGAAKIAAGEFESTLGEAMDDAELQVNGAALQIEGHIQEAAEAVQEALAQAAGAAKAAAARAGDAYGRASDTLAEVDAFVRDKSYLAVALAGFAGLLVGLLFAARSPEVIYVKPRD